MGQSVEERLSSLEKWREEVTNMVGEIKNDTADILAVIKGASTLGRFAKKHGPRALSFALGVLVSSGYIGPAVAAHIRGVFGL